MARNYNCIYKQLVEDKDDIVGHIAYSLYKQDKVEYINRFKEENGREPGEDELKPFHDASCLDGSIERYKESAINLLGSFLDETLSQTAHQLETEYEKHLEDVIKPLKTKWWEAIIQSVIGAFVFAILLAAFVFIYQNNGSDIPIPIHQDEQTEEITPIIEQKETRL